MVALKDAAKRLLSRVEGEGVDAFVADDPALVHHSRRFKMGYADQLTVFASGLLDYRVLNSALYGVEVAPPSVGAYTRRVGPSTLGPLREAAEAATAAGLPPAIDAPVRMVGGTWHKLRLAEPTGEVAWTPGSIVPPVLERLNRETAAVRQTFGAPPDEPTRS